MKAITGKDYTFKWYAPAPLSGVPNVTFNLSTPVSGAMTLTIALPVIFTVLISNLKIHFLTEDGNQNISYTVGLPDYMKESE